MGNVDTVALIRKEEGVTSFASLRYLKRYVNKNTGHCGTLDRFATGLLIACCGKFTKKVPDFTGLDKVYRAVVEFGRRTDTLDPEGNVVETGPVPDFETIERQVALMTGPLLQSPPAFSAIHIDGKRSYELARKGHEVQLQARPVTIYSADIISWNAPFLEIELHVSKGTYIRSYAGDLGRSCGSCACLAALERTKTGPFSLSDAVAWNDIEALGQLDENSALEIMRRLGEYRRPL